MINDIQKDAADRMQKSVSALSTALAKIRAGRAHTSLLDHVTVPYYGSDVPLSQVASVGIEDSRTLTVAPWEKNMVSVIEKAIMTSDLGVNPNSAGMTIRIPIPPLTEERRKDLVKVAKSEAENARIAVRNIRRDANGSLKDLLKDKAISEDEQRGAEEAIQKLTDSTIKQIDEVLAEKETDLMAV
ncbi:MULTISPECIES: ribosome recycling factor [Methylophaga]|jgi:ribosome recycling factor|uniref:Ribosome-recycling factor n=1 Tax=Methylophaga muralis TaxID=291169 RepID=A0A1E3GQL8_9GAMM|nr:MULTISPECIES: ribosome recycling factor [Methylophaga]ODN66330.1 Ribosome-recycling factor [Methylophaga muralis]THK43276.1 ribosome recycling factor [Methylophaga sp. SB9B]|tara:strand:+ start:7433 stop:7990 length:558 start_codon:yes stop_codon:yes gene_type:complete